MKKHDEFAAFYQAGRERVLVQALADLGDLPAAQRAVQTGYQLAARHWRRVADRPDREDWLRAVVWSHSSAPLRRTPAENDDAEATLAALQKLTRQQRRVLISTQLSTARMDRIAADLELGPDDLERELQTATAQFSVHRGIDSALVKQALAELTEVASGVTWPPARELARRGLARGRLLSAAGVVLVLLGGLAGGFVVTVPPGDAVPRPGAESGGPEPQEEPELVTKAAVLSAPQVARLDPTVRWRAGQVVGNAEGTGLVLPCQQARYADPRGELTFVRQFQTRSAAARTATQLVESSVSQRASRRAFQTLVAWTAACLDERTQLLGTYDLAGVGDEANMFTLRSWDGEQATTVTVGIARTGRVTTVVADRVPGAASPELSAASSLLAAAVNSLCGQPGTRTCAAPPSPEPVAPFPVGDAPGLLTEVDLPALRGVDRPWAGTEARKALTNNAAAGCAQAPFNGPGQTHALTRTFLIPQADLPDEFGLTQTVATMPRAGAARFITKARDRLLACAGENLGTSAVQVRRHRDPDSDLIVWRISTELSERRTLRYRMALLRHGTAVSQLGFFATPKATMSDAEFVALATRALDRLPNMPPPGDD